MNIETSFIAAGGNRHPSAADWDVTTSMLAFGTGRNIGLWKPLDNDHGGITSLLSGHVDEVNAVKFTTAGPASTPVLLSGAADGSTIVWLRSDGGKVPYRQAAVLKEHHKAINTIDAIPTAGVFCTGAADGEIRIWSLNITPDGKAATATCQLDHMLVPKFFPLATALIQLPSSSAIILAVAGSKNFVQLHMLDCNSSTPSMSLVATLTGHEAWIRSLSFTAEDPSDPDSDLLLASASQDKYIRLWRIHKGVDLRVASGAANDPLLGSAGKSLSNKAHRFTTADGATFSATFEALLLGHEDWIFSAKWQKQHIASQPRMNGRVNGSTIHNLKLLTASADNSLAVWEPDPISQVWICTVRLGELSAQKGATTATGSTGGFWIGLWSPEGDAVVSLGRTGGWRLWRHGGTEMNGFSDDTWEQDVAITGHTREVRALAWARNGSYLLSTSADQTTRLFAQWKHPSRSQGQSPPQAKSSWHEFARPQIHGYDLNCIDSLGSTRFISGADEKLLRVFDEPKAVADVLDQLCGINIDSQQILPDAANIPVLGLSNKAVDTEEDNDDADLSAASISSLAVKHTRPPTEDNLSRALLFPEHEKLYGHGHEITAVATNPSATIAATACRASSIDHALIRLYDTSTWRQIEPPLAAHSLTVTSLAWSPCGKWLVSVGRDRQCVVWGEKDGTWQVAVAEQKAHSRMSLDVAWAPQEAGVVFATAGRDKNVHIWRVQGAGEGQQGLERVASINATLPVTAVAFLQRLVSGKLVLAHALEDGSIHITRHDPQDFAASTFQQDTLAKNLAPSMAVTQMAWRPRPRDLSKGSSEEAATQVADILSDIDELAVASEDGSLRIYQFHLSP